MNKYLEYQVKRLLKARDGTASHPPNGSKISTPPTPPAPLSNSLLSHGLRPREKAPPLEQPSLLAEGHERSFFFIKKKRGFYLGPTKEGAREGKKKWREGRAFKWGGGGWGSEINGGHPPGPRPSFLIYFHSEINGKEGCKKKKVLERFASSPPFLPPYSSSLLILYSLS
uniref:Uncharacterized protein n=1 Tax=Morchella importuna TaxID=1174673 RepID=A0A650AFQ7_9PEZI|nr:hypothetical protein [Morchella importuna]QGN66754.1 hypothetical protein [Morchella importuna]